MSKSKKEFRMPAGRPRKPTAQLIQEGTYRADRHGTRGDISYPTLSKDTTIAPPPSLTRPEVVDAWRDITSSLISLGILSQVDLPMLEEGFLVLEKVKRLNELIIQLEGNEANLLTETYTRLLSQKSKYLKLYNDIMKDYYVTPVQRTKLILDVRKDGREESKLESIIKRATK